ncbi:MAG TPA: hypothetical protein VHB70_12245 [Parafilimonas sp.]|nr:hypothetical protein [Parafilimonas sp.]
MDNILTEKDIRIRAFRATDDRDTCLKFIEGHKKVLSIYGLENISTNVDNWIYNPSIFVIVVEPLDGEKLYGGVRLQCADLIHPLPIEDAIGKMDRTIHDIVKQSAQNGAAEISGLWNSKEVAGLGIGSFFPSRSTFVIAEQLGISTFFALCAPATVRFNQWLGSKILTRVGNNGTFYYPKLDLIATASIHEDLENLYDAHKREREKILFLRKNLQCVIDEKSIFKNVRVNVHYDLKITSADVNEFKLKHRNPSYII